MKIHWNWGKGIAAVYILFVVATLSFVGYSFTQKVELVSDNYYAQEVAYQDRIEQTERANNLAEKIDISIDNGNASISFPSDAIPQKGTIHFYHPSTSALDKTVTIKENADNKKTDVDIRTLPKGRWKVSIEWNSNGKEFYQESVVTL